MTVDLSQPIFMFRLVQRVYNLCLFHSESFSSQWQTIFLKSISYWVETMRRKYSIQSARKCLELSFLNVRMHFIQMTCQRCRVLETQSQKLRVLSDGHDIVASVPIKKALKDIGAREKDRSTISSKFPSR